MKAAILMMDAQSKLMHKHSRKHRLDDRSSLAVYKCNAKEPKTACSFYISLRRKTRICARKRSKSCTKDVGSLVEDCLVAYVEVG